MEQIFRVNSDGTESYYSTLNDPRNRFIIFEILSAMDRAIDESNNDIVLPFIDPSPQPPLSLKAISPRPFSLTIFDRAKASVLHNRTYGNFPSS